VSDADTPKLPARRKGDKRDKKHRFAKGNSGGGSSSLGAKRRRSIERAFHKAVSVEDFKAIATEIKAAALMQAADAHDWRVKLDAAKYIIDRFMGKAKQQVDVEINDNRASPTQIVAHFHQMFGLDTVAPQTKQVKAEVVDQSGPADRFLSDHQPHPALSAAGLIESPASLPEAVDRGPGDVQDRGEG
jgi:hypothetical protein